MANTIYASICVEAYSKISPETQHLASEQPQGRGSSRWDPKVCPGYGMSRKGRVAISWIQAPGYSFFAFSEPNIFIIYISESALRDFGVLYFFERHIDPSGITAKTVDCALIFRKPSKLNRFLYPHSTLQVLESMFAVLQTL